MEYIAIFFTILFFSTIEVLAKLMKGNIDPIYLAFLRFFISGIIILLFDIKNIKKIEKKDLGMLTLIGIIGVTISLGAFHLSIKYIEASKAAVIFSLNPIFSTLFAVIIIKEKLKIKNIIGLILGFCGVYLITFGFNKIELKSMVGALYMLLSAITFGLYIALVKKYIQKYGAFLTTGIIFIIGSLFYIPFIKTYNISDVALTIPLVAYIVIVGTGLAYIFYFYGLKRVPISIGSSMFYLKPIMAPIFAVIILNESLKENFYIGLFVIMTGLLINTIDLKKFFIKILIKK